VNREKFSQAALAINPQTRFRRSAVTADVAGRLNRAPAGSRLKSFQNPDSLATIDSYLYADMQAQGVTPADKTTDWEFIRRVTLDLTGRIPPPTGCSLSSPTSPPISAPNWSMNC
jgi:Protein of unknown function (DUF1549).